MTENKFNGWVSIINAVKTPLGFFTLIILSLDGILIAAATFTNEISIFAPLGLLGIVIVLMFVIVWKKPYILQDSRDWQAITVNLRFFEPDPHNSELLLEADPIKVDLEVKRCELIVCDIRGHVKHSGIPPLTFGHGGWTFQLAEDIEPTDSVSLELIECSGRTWKVRPFLPYGTDQRAIHVSGGDDYGIQV